jgi:GST-like protein
MLELYHWEPNGACARVMIALKEKGLDFQSRYVDVLAFEQHAPDFLKLNESGQTPVLVRDGEAFNESSYICEYLDEAFPQAPLMPRDPLERWAARAWQKYVDDYLAAAVSDLAWHAYGEPEIQNRDRASLEDAVARAPTHERRDAWREAIRGLGAEVIEKARERVRLTVEKIEKDLEKADWLAGAGFSLADVAAYPYMAYMPRLAPDLVNAQAAPKTMDWLKRTSERPAVKAAAAMAKTADPYAVAAPGPEHVRWG